MKKHSLWMALVVFVSSLVVLVGLAQDAANKATLKPTPVQTSDLQHLQHMAVYAQNALNSEAEKLPQYTDWQRAVKDLKAKCAEVAKENKWPQGTDCDINTLVFNAPAAQEKPQTAIPSAPPVSAPKDAAAPKKP